MGRYTYLGSRNLKGSAGNCLFTVAISSVHLRVFVCVGYKQHPSHKHEVPK